MAEYRIVEEFDEEGKPVKRKYKIVEDRIDEKTGARITRMLLIAEQTPEDAKKGVWKYYGV